MGTVGVYTDLENVDKNDILGQGWCSIYKTV